MVARLQVSVLHGPSAPGAMEAMEPSGVFGCLYAVTPCLEGNSFLWLTVTLLTIGSAVEHFYGLAVT